MPTKHQPAERVTNATLFRLINEQVLPEIKDIKGILRTAGLDNGHAADYKAFFDQRAESQAARKWLARKIGPVAKFRFIATAIGFISSVAWALLAIHQLAGWIKPPHV